MKITKRLISYIRVVKKEFCLGTILLFVSVLGIQLAPLIIRYIVDELLTPILQQNSVVLGTLLMFSALYIGVVLVSNVIGYVSSILLMDCANRIAEHLRNETYDKMQTLPISYFDDKPAGKISSRIVNNTETLRSNFYVTLSSQMLLNATIVVIIYTIIFILNIWVGLILLLLIPILYVWQKVFSKKTIKALNDYYEFESEINTQVNEVMQGSAVLQLFHQEKATFNRFENSSEKMLSSQKAFIKIHSILSWSLVELIKRFVLTGLIAYIGYQYLGGMLDASIGLLFAYVNYVERLFSTIGNMVRLLPIMQQSLATGRRVFELLDAPSQTDSTIPLQSRDGVVIFDRVSFGYNPEHLVLKDITFKANKGETIALVGHTGSGKSSIINLLFRFYDAQQGHIYIDGQDIQQYNRESVRADMGIVLQDPYLFTGTVKSNITMNNKEITEDQAMEALIKVGGSEMLSRFSKGIEEPVVEKGNTFSSGERQLISFARTLASNPKILILDEATSHIDTETENIIQHAMDVVKQGRTTFIIAHRLSTIQNADCILVLHEGCIVERGTHQELLTLNGKYAEMYRMQQKIA
ncbi:MULTISPECIES: ABC transporter ATP-binding protein [unclassified Granulicatella]|uniref:ABC transporter ATP-binding protein n=1 Tax=unclassified Granulicatella TaxID=2630493 RepID=UPI0010732D1C|nr:MULTISPECIES: ABC transporter ATP-binding protein [unclassified Granulicatella]MBF0779786.1 ABC transporter ATP-binding protein [Granulicatella sp. 19428wC4_WM01]TFU96188.1 ABC transporter ATP-binding protein [Granulicatella sp. WM01]